MFQTRRRVKNSDGCVVLLVFPIFAVDEFQRLAARALRIPIMDGNGFPGLAEGLIEQDRRECLIVRNPPRTLLIWTTPFALLLTPAAAVEKKGQGRG